MFEYKIIYSDYVKYSIIIFVENLKIKRIERFLDSGLEDVIFGNDFNKRIDDLYNEFFEYIEKHLSAGMIGVIQEKGINFYKKKVIFDIRGYNVVLTCRQYFKKKVIFIEDIQIRT